MLVQLAAAPPAHASCVRAPVPPHIHVHARFPVPGPLTQRPGPQPMQNVLHRAAHLQLRPCPPAACWHPPARHWTPPILTPDAHVSKFSHPGTSAVHSNTPINKGGHWGRRSCWSATICIVEHARLVTVFSGLSTAWHKEKLPAREQQQALPQASLSAR